MYNKCVFMTSLKIKIFYIITLFALMQYSIGARNVNIFKPRQVDCVGEKVFFVNISCKVRPINRHETSIAMSGVLIKDLNDIRGRIEIFKRYNKWQPMFLNASTDVCAFLSGKYNPFLSPIRKVLAKHTNLLHACPYKAPKYLYAKVVTLSSEDVDFGISIVPEGTYLLQVTGSESNGYPLGQIKIQVDVKQNSI